MAAAATQLFLFGGDAFLLLLHHFFILLLPQKDDTQGNRQFLKCRDKTYLARTKSIAHMKGEKWQYGVSLLQQVSIFPSSFQHST
jgi:hypothetical protein